MTIQVIGCGLGRTGTTSLKLALERLGMPTYHMIELNSNLDEDLPKWQQIVKCNGENYDWDELFTPTDGRPPYAATVDWPGSTYYKSILAKYPSAKVILTVRDNPQVWLESVQATIASKNRKQPAELKQLKDDIIWDHPEMFQGNFPENGVQVYLEWIRQVQEFVPKDQLLVFNVKEGWRPLCAFLGVEEIDEPFPHANDRESFLQRRMHVQQTQSP